LLPSSQQVSKGAPAWDFRPCGASPSPFSSKPRDDATGVAIRNMERAGIDIISDGEIRREGYSNHFATALYAWMWPSPR